MNDDLDRVFHALAHPVRRDIVARLTQGPATVGEATRGAGVTKPAVTKHLKALDDAGLVTRTVVGRTHRLALTDDGMARAFAWMERHRALSER